MEDGLSRVLRHFLRVALAFAGPLTSTYIETSGETSPSRNYAKRLPTTLATGSGLKWASFHVDLVGSELRMTGQPDDVQPLSLLNMPDVQQRQYSAYPLVDHIADKMVATFQKYGDRRTPSTRFKDLVDLVAILTSASVNALEQLAALKSEADRRAVVMPTQFVVPDRVLWNSGYATEARRSKLTVGLTLDKALAIVKPFTDPLLNGSAQGHWDPVVCQWRG
jgi:hypothetical protein